MTSDLALILSYQGIRLLSRVEGGWHSLGDVAFDNPDLSAALSDLRELAVSVSSTAFTTMLVVPNDQIKYLTFAATDGAEDPLKLRAQAQDALKEATPYLLDELMFDVHLAGNVVQVAAVARETLAEAEAFAEEHAFNPVCFTALPDEIDFAQAPDFGSTQAAQASGHVHEPDPVLISVVSEGLPVPVETEAEAENALLTQAMEALSDTPSQETQVAFSFKAEDQDQNEKTSGQTSIESDESKPLNIAEGDASDFTSIRAERPQDTAQTSAPLSGVSRKVHGTNAPSIPTDRMTGDTSSLRFDPAKAVAGLTAERADTQDAPEENVSNNGTFASARGKPKVAAPPRRTAQTTTADSSKPTKKSKRAAQKPAADFGFSQPAVGGKPKHLGLILTALLLVFMGLVALWATLFTEEGVAGLFSSKAPSEIAAGPSSEATSREGTTEPDDATLALDTAQTEPSTALDSAANTAPTGSVALTVPDGLTLDEGADGPPTAVLEELAPEELAESVEAAETEPSLLSDDEAKARYAVSGVWQQAPLQKDAPLLSDEEDIFVPAVDRLSFALDAVALPAVDALITDAALPAQSNPPAADAAFDLDERGLVVATEEGALNAEGVMIYAGRPPVVPAAYPKRVIVADALREQSNAQLQRVRPKLRPENLLEQNERATLGGLTRAELANKRPRLRPESAQDSDLADQAPTRLAIKASLRPRVKPANIAQLAARAVPDETTAAVVATPASSIVVPSIPTTASVARQATVDNAINLKKTSLIGVYGTSSNRRALVRLPSGRYKKVQVGDRIDGGKVAAIGEDELRYVKSGRNLVLKMPKDG